MKLQKHLSRKAKSGENYYKYEVVLPENIIEKAGFEEGDELEAEAKKGEIRMRRR